MSLWSCQTCDWESDNPADAPEILRECPRCKTRLPTRAEMRRVAPVRRTSTLSVCADVLLIGGGAVLFWCWFTGYIPGMIGGGFLAVIGAILFLKK